MIDVAQQNEMLEAKKKYEYYNKTAQIEKRKQEVAKEHEKELEQKKLEFLQREQYIQEVRIKMDRNAKKRVRSIE